MILWLLVYWKLLVKHKRVRPVLSGVDLPVSLMNASIPGLYQEWRFHSVRIQLEIHAELKMENVLRCMTVYKP